MGASGWSYYVPYVADLGEALERLREQVFRGGKYFLRNPSKKPKTIKKLLEMNAEEGTHSILDITRVAPTPTTPGRPRRTRPPNSDANGAIDMTRFDPVAHERWLKETFGGIGAVSELHPDDLTKFFGTTRPSHAQVEELKIDLQEFRRRGEGTVVVIYEGDTPKELFFTGFSGD
jgi:hypothetical protein